MDVNGQGLMAAILEKKYKIKRPQKGGKVFSIRLDGPNVNSVKKHRGIRQDIRTEISKQRCVVLDIGSSIEVDHKNGKYDELSNIELENQKIDDFQPLSKAANDAKRQHCKDCIKTGKRYDARRLGYKEGWVVGDENTSPCIGCYFQTFGPVGNIFFFHIKEKPNFVNYICVISVFRVFLKTVICIIK